VPSARSATIRSWSQASVLQATKQDGNLPAMKARISRKGQIVLPAEIRRLDDIRPGQQFQIERVKRGEYRLKRKERRRNEGLVDLLLACPVKGWFPGAERPYEIYKRLDLGKGGRAVAPADNAKHAVREVIKKKHGR
jgi:AbrB family looped-hinge helix DNA binding protein